MIAGRKLLLADDSAAIQKVIELTFADEGMQVFSVGNGRLALETLEQVAPDVVLADVFMPELNGYDLCRSIKQNERFARTPVMLLVSSFEPFDEDEARRAGADDIVAKPFQSIRQLVSRVGSLLGKSDAAAEPQSFSTLGLSTGERQTAPETVYEVIPVESEESPVTVLVEAPQMETHEVAEAQGATCSADIELQTADTQQLERITDGRVGGEGEEWQLQDTVEIEPVSEVRAAPIATEPGMETVEDYVVTPTVLDEETSAESTVQAMPETFEYSVLGPAPVIDESLLDVDERFISDETDDVILDLEFENAIDQAPAEKIVAYSPAVEGPDEWEIPQGYLPVKDFSHDAPIEAQSPIEGERNATETTTSANVASPGSLSPDAIDAIARRVVEQISEKVVREIAWEVVPELSELLIKQKLNNQR